MVSSCCQEVLSPHFNLQNIKTFLHVVGNHNLEIAVRLVTLNYATEGKCRQGTLMTKSGEILCEVEIIKV